MVGWNYINSTSVTLKNLLGIPMTSMRGYAGLNRSNTFLLAVYEKLTGQFEDPWIEQRVLCALLEGRPVEKDVLTPRQWYFVMRRLKQQRLIKNRKIGQRLMTALTDEGRRRAMILECQKAPDHYPPGHGCVVTFDVPEGQRAARTELRDFLKLCGFRLFQRSVWVSRKAVAAIIVRFVKELKIQDWVEVIEGKALT